MAELDRDIIAGDTVGSVSKSVLRLFEDEVELGPWRAPHEMIRQTGRGGFSHWERALFFSTSDNSDPSSNGRKYRILASTQSERGECKSWHKGHATIGSLPINYESPARRVNYVDTDAEYALECARSYLTIIPGGRKGLVQKAVLELGPGPSFATALVLKAWGAAMVAVSDRYLVQFDAKYHGALYRQLANMLLVEDPTVNVKPLEICAEAGHLQEQVCSRELPLEHMSREFQSFFHFTFSNAVLEHLYSPNEALAALYTITAPGGLGVHQVDFRDHRNFDQPLEYLLLDEMSFAQMFDQSHGECGNRFRPFQMEYLFRQAGFQKVKFRSNLETPPDYLMELLPRLRAARSSLFSDINKEFLVSTGGQFVVEK